MIQAEHVRRGKKAAFIADAYIKYMREHDLMSSRGRIPIMAYEAAKNMTPEWWASLADTCKPRQYAPSEETIGIILGILEARVRTPHVARHRSS